MSIILIIVEQVAEVDNLTFKRSINHSFNVFAANCDILSFFLIKWSQTPSTPPDADTHANHLKKFPVWSIVVGNLIVNDQNFHSIHHLISLHLGSLAVFHVV
jgi:hypothetical protein